MKFLNTLKTAALATLAALAFIATPAMAQTTTTDDTCTSGTLCGIPVDTSVFAIDLGATTYGEGLVQAIADGDTMETTAWVEKTSGIDLSGSLNTCGTCVENSAIGSAWEKIETGGTASATGTGEASAGVANASVGAVSLLARFRSGTATASAP